MTTQLTPVRYESLHETGKNIRNGTVEAKVIIERVGFHPDTSECVWGGMIAPHSMLVVGPGADDVRLQLAAALRKIADDLDRLPIAERTA